MQKENSVGCLIDLDGVVWHGGEVFDCSKEAFQLLEEANIPYVFVTNGAYSTPVITEKINKSLDISISPRHVVISPSPCIALNEYHNKRVLLCCQDDNVEIGRELGFKNFTTISEVIKIFPMLDYIDHERRKFIISHEETKALENSFEPIEAIVLLGEPIKWESSLQILIDLLMTNGDPRVIPDADEKFTFIPYPHIPIIACNKDLTFKGATNLPRFGHGAFLECLEHLYQRITKHNLVYTYLMGKPYMITYDFAKSALESLYPNRSFSKYFIIGDNPDVDIRGANLFRSYIKSKQSLDVESILVCTGVYSPDDEINDYTDILVKPNILVHDILFAVKHIYEELKLKSKIDHEL